MRLSNFLSAFVLAVACLAGPVAAEHDSLSSLFMQFSPAERRAAQAEMQRGGFYDGALDAAWSEQTSVALFGTADALTARTRGLMRPDMSSPEGIRSFISQLAAGLYAAWLYEGGKAPDA